MLRFGNARDISGTAVHCEDQLNPIFQCGGDRPFWNAVTIPIALRDVPLGDRSNRAERSNHDCRPSEAIGIKVTDDKDRLPCFAGGS